MEDIELVIKIPKEPYETYKGRPPMLGDAGMDMIAQSIANGIPLPAGHGDLVDRDSIEVLRIGNIKREYDKGFDAGVTCMVNKILDAPTIIEAEGSESE